MGVLPMMETYLIWVLLVSLVVFIIFGITLYKQARKEQKGWFWFTLLFSILGVILYWIFGKK